MNATAGPHAELLEVLEQTLASSMARTLLMIAQKRALGGQRPLRRSMLPPVVRALEDSLPAYVADPVRREACVAALRKVAGVAVPSAAPSIIPVRSDSDLLSVTDSARHMAQQAGMSQLDQTKLMTAVSELARNILQYATSGEIAFALVRQPRNGVAVTAVDQGPGIADIAKVMSSAYVSRTGMGMGLKGAKRLVDDLQVESSVGKGTTIRLVKYA